MEKNYPNPFWDTCLPAEERIRYLLSEMTLEEKTSFLATRQPALERLGILAFYFGGEAAHGVEARNDQANTAAPDQTTSFSQPIGMSSSWDTDLIEQAGAVTGLEARALFHRKKDGGLSRWAPTVDMERDPRWGRTEEGYGEDPFLTGEMASAYIRGMQGKDPKYLQMAASAKHFYANNVEAGRIWKSSSIDPRNKYEYYLEPFRKVIEQGHAEGLMTAYNEINGVPAILNHEIQDLAKETWGLSGHVVCDGGDMTQTVEFHHYYERHAQTVAEALKAGVDCFTDDHEVVTQAVREAYQEGLITEADIDRALKNCFRTKLRLGLYDGEKNPYAGIGAESLCTEHAAGINLKMAQESAVLLKNTDAFLPLEKTDDIVLIGPAGDAWFQDWYGGEPPYRISLKKGLDRLLEREVPFENGLSQIRLRFQDSYVGLDEAHRLILTKSAAQAVILEVNDWGFSSTTLYVPALHKYVSLYDDNFLKADKNAAFGWFVKESFRLKTNPKNPKELQLYGWNGCSITCETSENPKLLAKNAETAAVFQMEVVKDGIAAAVRLAAQSKKVIAALGCHPMLNSKEEIDRTDLILPPAQERLIQEIYKANPNTVLMLFTNYPYSINWEQEHLPAILQMATGSQEMGNAAADLLFGEAAPAGRLPLTWYRSVQDLPEMDDYDIIKGRRTYQYFDKQALYPFGYGLSYTTFAYESLQAEQKGDQLLVTVTVKNTGTRSSDEVIQIFGKRLSASRVRHPNKRLIGFVREKNIMPGEKRTAELTLSCKELEIYDVIQRRKLLEEGLYLFTAGNESLSCSLRLCGERIPMRSPFLLTKADHYDDYENIILCHAKDGHTSTAARNPHQTAALIYRDFDWTGKAASLTMQLKSSRFGCVRVLVTDDNFQEKYELAVWNGMQKDFAKTKLPLHFWPQGQDQKVLYIELQGIVQLESFLFEASR